MLSALTIYNIFLLNRHQLENCLDAYLLPVANGGLPGKAVTAFTGLKREVIFLNNSKNLKHENKFWNYFK
jgi:hypothetical protein